jgi:hypothetical protein
VEIHATNDLRVQPMKSIRRLVVAGFAAAVLGLFLQNPMPVVAGDQNGNQGNKRTLRLRVYFQQVSSTQKGAIPQFGDQFTLAGPVALFDTPNQIIGRFALQVVVTSDGATETLLSGILNLKDPSRKAGTGQVSFTGLTPTSEPRLPGPITGGTGDFKGAKGEIAHLTPAANVEELVVTFENGN